MPVNTSLPKHILPVIILAQFAGTSLWFAGNAIVGDLQQLLNLPDSMVGVITGVVQLGFIAGTLIFAVLTIADRYPPALVFLVCAVGGGLMNFTIALFSLPYEGILLLRFLTGFFLAGIYPVGMKIAADWYGKGLGKALGYLVGALVFGTALPHGLKALEFVGSWQEVLMTVSTFSILGGVLLYSTVGDGPNRKKGAQFEWAAIPKIFQYPKFRSAAFGYFGHMWELYTLWAFIPIILAQYNQINTTQLSIPVWSCLLIAVGGLGCIIGGYISLKSGSAKVAFGMLLTSGVCCLLAPWLGDLPLIFLIIFLLIWGFSVVGDSPQFSTLVARNAPPLYVGTALTIVNCIGFALTICSIQLMTFAQSEGSRFWMYWWLLPGPIFGLWALWPMLKKEGNNQKR